MPVSGSNENILQSCSGGGGGGGVCLRLQQLLGQVCGKGGRDETRLNKNTSVFFNKTRSPNTSHPALPHAALHTCAVPSTSSMSKNVKYLHTAVNNSAAQS
jgi:hypothetical protein